MSRAQPTRGHAGAAVLIWRQRLGLGQREFAARLGIAQPNLAAIESGSRGVPLPTMARWGELLGWGLSVEFTPPEPAA